MSRFSLILIFLALVAGIALGLYAATPIHDSNAAPAPQSLQLNADDQSDYLLNVADAYAADGNLKLAQDRLERLRDPQISARVEDYAINYASKRNQTALNLIHLAI